MLTEQGFASVGLTGYNSTLRHLRCTGLDGSALVAAQPDFATRSRAYGMTAQGELVGMMLPGEKRVLSCRCALLVLIHSRLQSTALLNRDACARVQLAADATVPVSCGAPAQRTARLRCQRIVCAARCSACGGCSSMASI